MTEEDPELEGPPPPEERELTATLITAAQGVPEHLSDEQVDHLLGLDKD